MKPYIIGHRGAMGTAPENTAVSFSQAVEQGADGVEFDVHMSRDGSLIVMHDARVDRTTDGSGFIRDLKLTELKKLDAGSHYGEEFRGEEVLTLEETLELVRGLEIINIELKNGPVLYPGIEEKLLSAVAGFALKERVIISSFNHYSINYLKGIDPEVKVGLLYTSGLYQPWEYARMVGAEAIHPYYASIPPDIIPLCQQQGIEVNVFGANRDETIREVLGRGVDMIITDYPSRALELKDELQKRQSEGES